jgi:hypothetical protein
LTGTQSVFATLQQNATPNFAQCLFAEQPRRLGVQSDLSGFAKRQLSAAQQQYTTVQQDFQSAEVAQRRNVPAAVVHRQRGRFLIQSNTVVR